MQIQKTPKEVATFDQAEIERKVGYAKSLLILDHPFFGYAVTRRTICYEEAVPTALMLATGQMYLNPKFLAGLTVKRIMFLLAHEAMHFMLCHAERRKQRDPVAWNIACDKVINDLLIDAEVGIPIEGGVTMPGARNFSAEELYDPVDNGDGEGNGGIGNDIGEPVEAESALLAAQSKFETVLASKAAKDAGKLPAGVERIVKMVIDAPTPWYEILEQFMTARYRAGVSWQRPNRRFLASGQYLPGPKYLRKMGPIVIGVDTSGSISDQELCDFSGHVNRILELCCPEGVTVIYCDSVVNHVEDYLPEDLPITLHPFGGGGTSFRPVFDYIDERGLAPEIVVYLTDGNGDQRCFVSSHETIWLTTDSDQFSWGQVIRQNPF
ncbi:DUF2201 family putative metallopeptidase [Pseudopelagicola sp. nBUS_20]|uniref:vWA domain-containing protein n=1 Tax=Pseudopelagicola sp. nBUS_20 TaxID=3395317 RepID=UPI003EB8C808